MTRPDPQAPGEHLGPAYHFTDERHRINDPNGLVYLDGEFHLFHQYEIGGLLHWGHAVSTDLVRWTQLPIALYPDEHGHIYSGTAVVDRENVSGLGADGDPALLAFFTYHAVSDGSESQAVAWSVDRGRTWTKYAGNPVVANPGLADFRDPKVFWHEPSRAWVMVVAAGDRVRFHRSVDLLNWEYVGSWGETHGAHGGLWECPDLFSLPVVGTARSRWILSVSVSDGAPGGGSGMQYFVGDFDGWTFSNDNDPATVLWQNWGGDFYAGLTWEGVPPEDGRRLMIAWADNWRYRNAIPAPPFNGQLTVVRELTLCEYPEGVRLVHTPVHELETLRGAGTSSSGFAIGPGVGPGAGQVVELGQAYEVLVEFDVARATAREFGMEVHVGDGERTRIGYDLARRAGFVDRRRSGLAPHPDFAARHDAPADPVGSRVTLRVLVDRNLVEVFVNDREQLVDLVLPSATSGGFRLFSDGGSVDVVLATIHPLASVRS